jgi:hypothetical protein
MNNLGRAHTDVKKPRLEPFLGAMRLLIVARMLVAALVLVSAAAASTARGARKAKPWTATGWVVDVQGRPVEGAALDVSITNEEYRSVTIGRGVSGADGGFTFRLTTNDYGDLGLGVEAPGFARWALAGFPRGVVGEKIVLHRIVDRPFIEKLRAVRDPAERDRRVLEIAASDDLPEINEMFPYLGELRPDLAAIVRAGTTEPRDRRDRSTPADTAARLLAYWADPADDAFVLPWVKKNWGGRPANVAHIGLAAASIYEVCNRWREIHFIDQGIKGQRTWNACLQPVLDRTGSHALALFRVRYAYWGYDMYLVMRREGERWVLRGVAENNLYHYRPDDQP